MREYAVVCREYYRFVCLDNKHRINVGEPNFPVAAAERGRQVIVSSGERMVVGDHDFTKFSVIPSVIFEIDVPDDISESWYTGQVHVGFKDAVFEPSSPVRHAAELYRVLTNGGSSAPVLFVYTDGGPDRRLTYISVQISLICLFKKLDLDYLCACRTAPYHSWRNPVERIMSVINLGLQSVGLAHREVEANVEAELSKCNSLADLRKLAAKGNYVVSSVADSLSPVKLLLTQIMFRLVLKEKQFSVFTSATPSEINEFWTAILALESTLNVNQKINRANLEDYSNVRAFIDHCCVSAHYSFGILKCGSSSCNYCSPPQLPMEIFVTLQHLPYPTPGPDNHFVEFSKVFGTTTSEEHRPSLSAKRPKKSVPIPTSMQHAKNTNIMIQCEECSMWRLVYSPVKQTSKQRENLLLKLEQYAYSCGSELTDMDVQQLGFPNIYVRNLVCNDPVECLYYSAGYEPICIYCSNKSSLTEDNDTYPQCQSCTDKGLGRIKKRK